MVFGTRHRTVVGLLCVGLGGVMLSALDANAQSGLPTVLPPADSSVPVVVFEPPAAGELPPIYDPAIRLAEAPSLPARAPLGLDAQQQAKSFMPPGTRKGLFQKASFQASYLPRFEGDALGISTLSTSVVLGVPFPKPQTPVLFTPQYRVRFLDGPDFTDVPARVHEAELGVSHFRKLSDRWLFNGAVTIGVYADDHSFSDSDAVRVTGRALGIYELSNTWKGVVGVVYLNRAGLSVVPAAGLMYDRGDFKVDLIFPRPRVAWLLPGSTHTAGDQRWFYLMGEIGGNIWAVRRATAAADTLSYGDARIVVGWERKVIGGISQSWELGYVFNRELEYDSEGFESELDDTLMLRAGWTY